MRIAGMCSPVYEIGLAKVPEYDQEVKLDNGVLYAKVTKSGNRKEWVSVSSLKSKREANQKLFDWLKWDIDSLRKELDMSKAELKRQLIRAGIIN
ncbi:hypothetical protein K7I13_12065 [Brucepastera parasyntrophica]|uniref:hypothetical protein n=1 Tax=Brucepastera parasyntrophica TaxID=2880008 RepID=UPI0021095B8D|nr:hypothetical protein [Brucepastera parasyntrophica]ULQ59222.1 hypothetical protein K7I13_12065 [Brucepastera parasyntrophica]